MKFATLTKNVPVYYKSRTPLHIKGRPGAGKSDWARSARDLLADHYGEPFGLVEVMLAQREPSDIHGIPVPSKDNDGILVTKYTRSDIFEAIRATGCARGILLAEERDQSPTMVQNAFCRALLDRYFGADKLPDGWWIISTSNRAKDRAGVNKPPTHAVNREFTYEMEPDLEGWCGWAVSHNIDWRVIAFARFKSGLVFENDSPPEGPFLSPRSLVMAHNWMRNYAEFLGTPDTLSVDATANEAIAGVIGSAAAGEMMSFLRVQTELPDIEDIIADPMKAKVPAPGRLDVTYAVVEMCVAHSTPKNVDAVFTYVTRLAKEFQTAAAKQIIAKSKDGTLLNSAVMTKWIMENKALVIASIS